MASEHWRGFRTGIDWSRRLRIEADRVSGTQPDAGPVSFRDSLDPRRRTRTPRAKDKPAASKPSPHEGPGSAAVNATVVRTAPAVLGLLADGVPRSRPAIVAALAGRHDRQDVPHTLIRLAVTGQVVETGGKYTLATAPEP